VFDCFSDKQRYYKAPFEERTESIRPSNAVA
jgi:hypothetical protein